MSKESRRRLRGTTEIYLRNQTKRRFRLVAVIVSVLLCVGGFLVWQNWPSQNYKPTAQLAKPNASDFIPPKDLPELCRLSTNDLAKVDIALMNLLCTQRLPGTEDLKIPECLERLDGIARYVKTETERHLYRFRQRPADYENSEGYFRMLMMVTVLQQDLGIRYNPARVRLPSAEPEPTEVFFADPKDIFIHGLIREKGMGTCSSMPVFLVSVGRRLEYPLKLVRAKGHLFVRWDEGDKSFNIEGTSVGFVSHSDEEYRNWPRPFTAEEEKTEGYLKSLTPAQELATFFLIRGGNCLATTNWAYASAAFAQAFYKEPESVVNQRLFAWAERKAFEAGALPPRLAIQYLLDTLELPPHQMQPVWALKKAELYKRNVREDDVQRLESEIALLKAEIQMFSTIKLSP